MKKKFFLTVALSALCLVFLNAKDVDPTEGKEKISRAGLDMYVNPDSPLKEGFLNGKYDKSLTQIKELFEKDKQNPRAPAPPVSGVGIWLVASEKGGEELIAPGQTQTNRNHGGSTMYVSTVVKGYGGISSDFASYGGPGFILNYTDFMGIDEDKDSIIDGWAIVWNLSGKSPGGQFLYTTRSMNPGPTMQTYINIR